MTAQPRSASSVGRSVVRRRLSVMLTMTIDDDSATHRPTSAAAIGSRPVTRKTTAGDDRREDDLDRRHQQDRAVVASQPGQVDLDADLEQQQHDTDVGQQLELLAVGDVARRERREAEPDRQVADDRGEVQPAREPAGGDRGQQDEADLEDGRRLGVHLGDGTRLDGLAGVSGVAPASTACPRGPTAPRPRSVPSRQPMNRAIATTATMIVEIALIWGVTPNLIEL